MVITDVKYNHPFTFFVTHPIYQQFIHTDTIKDSIVSQTHIKASSKQLLLLFDQAQMKKIYWSSQKIDTMSVQFKNKNN